MPDSTSLKRRNRELAILNTIAAALNREIDLGQALRTTLAQVVELCELRTSWIWLLNEQTEAPYLAATLHLPPALSAAPERMEGSCYCLDTFCAGDMAGAANVNVITCSRLKKLVDGTDGLRYHASIPLYAHGRRLGVLNVASADWRELTPDDLRLLYTIGDLLSIAIERARLFANSVQLGALEERNRLAREIHDTLAQGMAAVAFQLETADALLEAGVDGQRVRQVLQQALGLTRANLEEARRSVVDLRAAPLEGRTLAEALPALAAELAAPSGLAVTCAVTGAERLLPLRATLELYRIAQEAITNVLHHARASQLTVQLTITPAQATLLVADNGRGFDLAQVPSGHFGLIGMRERVRLLRGTFHIASAAAHGTRVEVSVPLLEGKHHA